METSNYSVVITEADKTYLNVGVMQLVFEMTCKRCNRNKDERVDVRKCTTLVLKCSECSNRQEGFSILGLIHERLRYHCRRNSGDKTHAKIWDGYFLTLPYYETPYFLC